MSITVEELIAAYNGQDYSEAVRLAQRAILGHTSNDNVAYVCGAILIDCGGATLDIEAVEKGIAIYEDMIADESVPKEVRKQARYNLSNGFGSLALIHEKKSELDERLASWQLQRDHLQVLVLDPEGIPKDMLPQILTNFGNVLDELGRPIEAQDCYQKALKLNPNHPIALGSLGQLMQRLLGIQPAHTVRLLYAARTYLQQALSNPEEMETLGSMFAKNSYTDSLAQVDAAIDKVSEGDKAAFDERINAMKTRHADWEPNQTAKYWSDQGLLLTVNPYPAWCPSTLKDDLYFSGIVTKGGQEGIDQFNQLAHTLNQIKEEYALARYLLQMSSLPGDLTDLSALTQFADTLDYADFGLASGLLKASIGHSIDMLDKIANFLNRYFELGIRDKSVTFASIWYEKGNTDPKTRVDSMKLAPHVSHNGWLRGLRDIAETLNLYPAPSKDIRNKATHDFLLIENIVRPTVVLHGQSVSVDAHEFARDLLIMAKDAIVLVIATVQREEATKKSDPKLVNFPIEFRYSKGISDQLSNFDDE